MEPDGGLIGDCLAKLGAPAEGDKAGEVPSVTRREEMGWVRLRTQRHI